MNSKYDEIIKRVISKKEIAEFIKENKLTKNEINNNFGIFLTCSNYLEECGKCLGKKDCAFDDYMQAKLSMENGQVILAYKECPYKVNKDYLLEMLYFPEVDIEDQKVVYRETIKKVAVGEGKHKKQSGGAGQYGHVFIRFEPYTENFAFESEVVGGAVPKGYFPAVEKGLIETFEHGPLAGFPVINVKAVLFDGSYHDVDSNEISFKLAASLAFKNAVPNLGATILEPIEQVEVRIKEQYVGDVMGDINKRRGRVLGLDQEDNYQIIHAEVPQAEITKYAIDLKAMTQGSGQFTRQFLRYEEVPHFLIDKIVEAYKK